MASLQNDLSAVIEKIAEAKLVAVALDRAEGQQRRTRAAEALALVEAAGRWLETVRRDLIAEVGEGDG